MSRVLVIVAALVAAVSLGACSSNAPQVDQTVEEQQTEQDSTVEETPEESQDPAEPAPLADDDVVNEFITAYNAISGSPITEVEDGNIRTKFFAYSYGYYLELLHANDTDKITVTISETNENASAGVAGMRDVFCDVVRTIDPSVTADQASTFLDSLISGGVIADDQQIGTARVLFVPDAELSNGHSRGHIEVSAQ